MGLQVGAVGEMGQAASLERRPPGLHVPKDCGVHGEPGPLPFCTLHHCSHGLSRPRMSRAQVLPEARAVLTPALPATAQEQRWARPWPGTGLAVYCFPSEAMSLREQGTCSLTPPPPELKCMPGAVEVGGWVDRRTAGRTRAQPVPSHSCLTSTAHLPVPPAKHPGATLNCSLATPTSNVSTSCARPQPNCAPAPSHLQLPSGGTQEPPNQAQHPCVCPRGSLLLKTARVM